MSAISTRQAPAAIGPYVQATDTGQMIFTSGQLPIHPETGMFSTDIRQQVRQSLDNIRAIIEAGGLQIADIVKTTLYVKDLNQFSLINEEYEAFFLLHHSAFPARSCVEVARLPKDAGVEIEAIAVRRSSSPQ